MTPRHWGLGTVALCGLAFAACGQSGSQGSSGSSSATGGASVTGGTSGPTGSNSSTAPGSSASSESASSGESFASSSFSGTSAGGTSSGGSSSSTASSCGSNSCSGCPAGYHPADSCLNGVWQCACALGSASTSSTSGGSTGKSGGSSGGSSSNGSSSSGGSSSGGPGPCPPGTTNCAGVCANLQSNPDNCGACGFNCIRGDICALAICVPGACGTAGSFCTATSDCCIGLDCDPSNFACAPPFQDAGHDAGTPPACPLDPADAGCLTAADCLSPNVCLPAADGGGYCGAAATPSASCIPNGGACRADSGACCGGGCDGGLCAARGPCGVTGQACASNGDCCNDFACDADAGSCQPSCGGLLAGCDTADGNAGCCTAPGLTCLPLSTSGTAGVCDYAQYQNAAGTEVYCGGPCSTLPCALGVTCAVPLSGLDPCAASGLVCDAAGEVCRNPGEEDPCLPGGPPCQPLPNSTVTDLQCLRPTLGGGGGGYLCLQPCSLSDPAKGTSDCVDPLTICMALGDAGAACLTNGGCTSFFGACDSGGVSDGLCLPYDVGVVATGLCLQASLDGGGPGAACDSDFNRQNGGFCDPTSYCVGGVCQANCNAGFQGGLGCAASDAGPAVTCQAIDGQTGNALDFGTCSVACDFTNPDGGGCPTVGGVPEKCLPPADYGLPDATTGLCVEAPAAGSAVAVGQPCAPSLTLADPCVDGALCLGGFDEPYACVQLCTEVGVAGASPCQPDQICQPLFGEEAEEGYCGLPDGGLGG